MHEERSPALRTAPPSVSTDASADPTADTAVEAAPTVIQDDDHETRRNILGELRTRGPSRRRALAIGQRLSRSVFLHHVRILIRQGKLEARRIGGVWVYSLPSLVQGPMEQPSHLAQEILEAARTYPGLSQAEIAKMVGTTQSYVSRILARSRRETSGSDVPRGP